MHDQLDRSLLNQSNFVSQLRMDSSKIIARGLIGDRTYRSLAMKHCGMTQTDSKTPSDRLLNEIERLKVAAGGLQQIRHITIMFCGEA